MRRVLLAVLIIAGGVSLVFVGFREQFAENLDSVSEIKAQGVMSRMINQAVYEKFGDEKNQKKLFTVEAEGGTVKTVQPNTPLLNALTADFGLMLQEKYGSAEAEKVSIPLGAFMGSRFLSMTNLKINIKVLPMSVSSFNYESSFEAQGINQTRYRLYLNVVSTVRILQPFSSQSVEVKNRILLAEMVIVGDVPDNYVNVPKEDILDAIN